MTVYDTTSPPKATLLRSAEDLQLHEFAQLFPPLEGEEYEALKADIAANGLREPVYVYGHEKKLLEGRNRYRAALELNRFIRPVQHPASSDAEALEFVLSQSRHRDCLTQEQFDKITALRARLEPARKKLVLGGPPSDEDSPVWLAFHARLTPLKVVDAPAPGANPPPEPPTPPTPATPPPAPAGANPPTPADASEVLAELRALRAQVAALQEQVALLVAGQAPASPAPAAAPARAAALHPLVAAAQARGVSRRTVMTARRIVRDGAPCVVDAALSGALSLHKAGGICTYPHEVQVQICTSLHLFAPAGANPVQTPECNLHLPSANQVQTGANPLEAGANQVQIGANQVQIPVQTGANEVQTGANEVQIPVQAPVQTGANEVQIPELAPAAPADLHQFAPAGANSVQAPASDLHQFAPAGANQVQTRDELPPSMRKPAVVEAPPKPLDNLYELIGIEQPPAPPDSRAIEKIEENVPMDENNPIFRRGEAATLGWMNVTEAVASAFNRPVDLPVKPGRPPTNTAQPNHPHFMTHFYGEWLRSQGSTIAEEEDAGRLRWEDPPEGATLCRAWVCPERAGPFTKHLLRETA